MTDAKETKYNPHAYNRWPDVTPPEGVWMLCSCGYCLDVNIHLVRARLDSGAWVNEYGYPLERYGFTVIGFRPFYEPEDDFEGAVVLSIEEAEKIEKFFDAVDQCAENFRLDRSEMLAWANLGEKIRRAKRKEADE